MIHLLCRSGHAYFAVCYQCQQYQIVQRQDKSCLYCTLKIKHLEYNQLEPKQPILGRWNEYQLVHWLCKLGVVRQSVDYKDAVKQLSRVALEPNGRLCALGQGLSVQERVEQAKRAYICAPMQTFSPYWDYPGTVGTADGIFERQCWVGEHRLLTLECGPTGRCFIHYAGLATWVRYHGPLTTTIEPFTLKEIDLRRLFYQGEKSPRGRMDELLALLFAPDCTLQLQCAVPLGGFEFGILRRVAEEYVPTIDDPMNAQNRDCIEPLMWSEDLVDSGKWLRGIPEVPDTFNWYWNYPILSGGVAWWLLRRTELLEQTQAQQALLSGETDD